MLKIKRENLLDDLLTIEEPILEIIKYIDIEYNITCLDSDDMGSFNRELIKGYRLMNSFLNTYTDSIDEEVIIYDDNFLNEKVINNITELLDIFNDEISGINNIIEEINRVGFSKERIEGDIYSDNAGSYPELGDIQRLADATLDDEFNNRISNLILDYKEEIIGIKTIKSNLSSLIELLKKNKIT